MACKLNFNYSSFLLPEFLQSGLQVIIYHIRKERGNILVPFFKIRRHFIRSYRLLCHLERILRDMQDYHTDPHIVGMALHAASYILSFSFFHTEHLQKEVFQLLLHPRHYHLLFPQLLELLRSYISQLPISNTHIQFHFLPISSSYCSQ